MGRRLLINAAEAEETRIALLEDGRLEELRTERSTRSTLLGSIFKGRVVNVEQGIGAAFVDIGCGRNAFLHVSDCPGIAGGQARIEDHAPMGGEVLVQVTREGFGSKGPVLTASISLPGRFLVLLPFAEAAGASRRIPEEADREKLREMARLLGKRAGCGVIVRTAGAEATRRELLRDLRALQNRWNAVLARAATATAPALLYAEGDVIARALRDLLDRQVEEVVADTPEAAARAREALASDRPTSPPPVRLHEQAMPLFHASGVEEQVDRLKLRRVPLPSGGSIIIDRTEAMVAIDVNSGRTREGSGLEETALQANLEAAAEVARQIRLRDLGGVIAVDFIDMTDPEHVRQLDRLFRESLRRDRAKLRPGRLGPFCVFVLTRRKAAGETPAAERVCPRCGGAGHVVAPEEVALRAYRELSARAAGRGRSGLLLRLAPEASALLQPAREGALRALEEESGRPIRVEADPALPLERWEIRPLRGGSDSVA